MGFSAFSQPTTSRTGGFSSFSATPLETPKETKPTFGGGKKPDLTTAAGLIAYAHQVGVSTPANIIESGEDPHRAFSGGFIQDMFDVLNAPQSVVAGLAKNMKPIDAIMSRASFSDAELLGKYGTKGKVAGIISDIATDPLNVIPVLGIGKRILQGARKGAEFIKSTGVGKTAADFLGKRLVYRYGQDPVYASLAEDTISKINRGGQQALELTRPITELPAAEQRIIAEARKAGNVKELPPALLNRATPAFQELDRLGKEAVDLGFLDAAVYEENVGRYMARLYRKHEMPEGEIGQIFFDKKPVRIDTARFKKRTDIPEDIRQSMGEILEAGYPTARALAQLNQAIERGRFFSVVAGKWGKVAEEASVGMKQLPDTKELGQLRSKYVPEPIFDDVQEIIRSKSWGQKIEGKIVSGFKYGKVVMNPATHARNIMSNMILNDFEGLSPSRVDIYARAAYSLAKKDELYQEAKKVGLGLDNFWGSEIKALLENSADPAIKRIPKEVINKMGELYQKEEQWAKMAQFVFQKSKGLSSEEAYKIAERATFNYAQVTPFIRKLRESIWGLPFITFTYKATPQVAKTLVERPAKIGKYGFIKRGVEGMSPQDQLAEERAAEPEYIKQGFYVRLPHEDQYGRSLYFDMTYILPFGDLIGTQFFQPSRKGETPAKTLLSNFPILNAVGELYTGKDFFGKNIEQPTSETPAQIGMDYFNYLTKMYGPPPFFDTPRRLQEAVSLSTLSPEQVLQKRTITEEILRNFGLKTQPFNVELQKSLREKEAKDIVTEKLEAAKAVRIFKRPFIPKR